MKGVKYDSGKAPLSFIPRAAAEAEAYVWQFGAKKYARGNFRKGFEYSRALDALMRHATAIAEGEWIDEESGLPHAAHVRCCAAMLLVWKQSGTGINDLDVK